MGKPTHAIHAPTRALREWKSGMIIATLGQWVRNPYKPESMDILPRERVRRTGEWEFLLQGHRKRGCAGEAEAANDFYSINLAQRDFYLHFRLK